METRASYMLVGIFSLLAVVGALLFVIWAARTDQSTQQEYEISFHQNVSGLSVGNDVLLSGVRVGQVSRITLSPTKPGAVQVRVRIDGDAPVRQDSTASMEPLGVTGLSVVSISGGTEASPIMKAGAKTVPTIPSQLSRLQTIMATVPAVLNSANTLLDRASAMLTPENAQSFNNIMTSVAELSDTLSQRRGSIDSSLVGMADASKSLAQASRRLDSLMLSSQKALDGSFSRAAESVDKAATRMDGLITAMQPGMTRFSRDGVEDLQQVLLETKKLMISLNRLTQKLESDPRRFFFGNSVPELRTK